MKLRGTLTQLGLSWLDRLLPAFEKLNRNTVTLYFNPTQMSLVLRPDDATTGVGGVDAHADVRISSNNDDDVWWWSSRRRRRARGRADF